MDVYFAVKFIAKSDEPKGKITAIMHSLKDTKNAAEL